MPHKHPANIARHDDRTPGDRVADAVARNVGSWRFIITQTFVVSLWIMLNIVGFAHHWDVYPFILLNLMFSTQAAYAAPILQLSQNRQAEHDRVKSEHDYEVNQAALDLIMSIDAKVDQIEEKISAW